MKPYVIKQGDYLAKLGHLLGFEPNAVWKHEKNAELREKRGDGAMLCAGDVLFVPDEPKKRLPFDKETTNRYVAKVPRMPVTFVLAVQGEPLADEPYQIEGLDSDDASEPGAGEALRTDGEGNVCFEVPVHVRAVTVVLPERKQRFRVMIGNLDPIDEPSGVKMRLMHLGHYSATLTGADGYVGRDDERIAAGLKSFQAAHGLPGTGELDHETRAKLLEVHGS